MIELRPTREFLSDAQVAIGVVADRLRELTTERDQLRAELSKLQAEREPRDNGDGTETKLLPVTYPSGWSVAEVRAPRSGDLFVGHIDGEAVKCVNEFAPLLLRLILRPAPKPPEPVTWEARIVDGEAVAAEHGLHIGDWLPGWNFLRGAFGIDKPPKLGRYQFRDGVGTLIEAAQ